MKAFFAWLKSLFIKKSTYQTEKPDDVIIGNNNPWTPPTFKLKSKLKPPSEIVGKIDSILLQERFDQFKKACVSKDGNTLVGLAGYAMERMKIREDRVNNTGYWVSMIQKVMGYFDKESFWCMYAYMIAVGYAEIRTGSVSPIYKSGSCASVRTKSPKECLIFVREKLGSLSLAEYGDAVIFQYVATGKGHIGTFIKFAKEKIVARLYEGNTTQGLVNGKIDRDGGGFYETERTLNTSSMVVAAVVRPFPNWKIQ